MLIHTISAISEEAMGPSYSVVRLCEVLIKQGCDVTLTALDWSPMVSSPEFSKTFPLGYGPRRLGRAPAMKRWLESEVKTRRVSLLHNHGLWMMSNIYPGWVAERYRIPYVVSPRGTLSSWAMRNGSKIKQFFWPLVQKPALKTVVCWHATADSEYDDIRQLGFRQPVAIIPNGIDVPNLPPKQTSNKRTLLFLGRIHRKKGLDLLLSAWKIVENYFPEWQLVIAGPDNGGYLAQMQRLANKLNLKRVEFSGPLFGRAKWSAYRHADLFILSTYSENFGMTIAEALAAGTPVIVSKGAPWEELEIRGAGWWIEIGIDPLVVALQDALSQSPEKLRMMGERGVTWMRDEFSWHRIGQRMAQTYQWISEGGAVPPWVKCA